MVAGSAGVDREQRGSLRPQLRTELLRPSARILRVGVDLDLGRVAANVGAVLAEDTDLVPRVAGSARMYQMSAY